MCVKQDVLELSKEHELRHLLSATEASGTHLRGFRHCWSVTAVAADTSCGAPLCPVEDSVGRLSDGHFLHAPWSALPVWLRAVAFGALCRRAGSASRPDLRSPGSWEGSGDGPRLVRRSSLPLAAATASCPGLRPSLPLEAWRLWARWFPLAAGRAVVMPIALDCVKMK